MKNLSALILLKSLYLSFCFPVIAQPTITAEQQLINSHNQASLQQVIIDNIDTNNQFAAQEYLSNMRSADLVDAYNKQLKKLLIAQENEVIDLQKQINSLQETEQATLPMVEKMLNGLKVFIAQDSPFLLNERQSRLKRLQKVIARADISLAEKYRQILQAYNVEVQYGRTLEAYQGVLEEDVKSQKNFFRLGRLAFYQQSLDKQVGKLWQPATRKWQVLNNNDNEELSKAIAIAKQIRSPDLLSLPVAQFNEKQNQ